MDSTNQSKAQVRFEFEVEKIIGISADGRYQVQWAPAWVSKFHLVGCEHLVQEFLREQQQEADKGKEVRRNSHSEELDMRSNRDGGHENHTLVQLETDHQTSELQSCKIEPKEEVIYMETYPHTSEQSNDLDGHNLMNDVIIGELNHHNESGDPNESNLKSQFVYGKSKSLNNISDSDGIDPSLYDISQNESPAVFNNECTTDNSFTKNETSCQSVDADDAVSYSCPQPFAIDQSCTQTNNISKQSHQNYPDTQQEKKKFNCTYCGKKFGAKQDLKRHIRTHTGDRPYSCDICNSTFTLKANLKRHLRNNTCSKQ